MFMGVSNEIVTSVVTCRSTFLFQTTHKLFLDIGKYFFNVTDKMWSLLKKFCAEFVSNVQIMNMFFILKHETLKRAFVFSANELKPHKKRVWQSIKILVCFSFVLLLTSNNNKNNTVLLMMQKNKKQRKNKWKLQIINQNLIIYQLVHWKKQTNTA